jgi:hypothetical protein
MPNSASAVAVFSIEGRPHSCTNVDLLDNLDTVFFRTGTDFMQRILGIDISAIAVLLSLRK